MKNWQIKQPIPENHELLNDYPLMVAQLLYNRGFQKSIEATNFFNPAFDKIHDPFLFADMAKATERIWLAIINKEKILIHGDYDADGVTSSAILYKTLKILGAEVEVFIPHRENDGYGLNINNLPKFVVEKKIKILITVDCGITNVNEVDWLNTNGVEVIITDHHEPPEILPLALAIIDPKVKKENYPCPFLSGAGVAYKLSQALLTTRPDGFADLELSQFGGAEGFAKWLLDLVAIGTVADIVPLLNENRVLTKWGLVVLAQTKNIGLKKLFEKITISKFDSFAIGFQIAPRLNAAGRMKHAEVAFQLLVTEDLDEAEALAQELNDNNSARQKILEQATTEMREMLSQKKDEKVFFLYNENWAPGIIGLIAGRVADEFYRPVLAMTNCGGRVVGSGRSIVGVDIIENITAVSEHLARFGGHSGACGFTLKSLEIIEQFEKDFRQQVENSLSGIDLQPSLYLEGYFDLDGDWQELVEWLEKFAPFGEGNTRPLFWLKDLKVASFEVLGETGNHLRLMVRQNSPRLHKIMFFGKAKEYLGKLKANQQIEAVVEVSKNVWQGQVQREIKVVDLRIKD